MDEEIHSRQTVFRCCITGSFVSECSDVFQPRWEPEVELFDSAGSRVISKASEFGKRQISSAWTCVVYFMYLRKQYISTSTSIIMLYPPSATEEVPRARTCGVLHLQVYRMRQAEDNPQILEAPSRVRILRMDRRGEQSTAVSFLIAATMVLGERDETYPAIA